MAALYMLLLAMAAPFWETKPPEQWTDEQLAALLNDSPWAQTTLFQNNVPVAVYLATAKPARLAEQEMHRRYTSKLQQQANPEDTSREEYLRFLEDNGGKAIVIAVRNTDPLALLKGEEAKNMEKESVLKAGGKKYKMIGHFPPAPSDPVLRLAFPKPENLGKELNFELYLPGVTGPYRQAVFKLKDLTYNGKPEM